MLVLTHTGHMGYVVAEARGLSRVLIFETYTEHLMRTADLRPFAQGDAALQAAA